MQPERKKQQFSKCWWRQQAVENLCKVFPGTRSYRSLCKCFNVGVEKYVHTFLNDIEQKCRKTPWQPENRGKEWESYLRKSHSGRAVKLEEPSPGPGSCPHPSLGAGARIRTAGMAHHTPAVALAQTWVTSQWHPAMDWFCVLQDSFCVHF